jgi:integrase/recombinase XerD
MKIVKCVEIYVERKRTSGFIYAAGGKILMRFARFVGNLDISLITERHVELFLTRNAVSNNTWRRYVLCLTKFFIYWRARRQLKQIPCARPKPATKPTFFPFVYTRSEIRRLLDATAPCLRYPRCSLDAETVRAILLLIYGTGMHIGDVLNLMDSDVDLMHKTIQIRSAYAQLTRRIPIGADVGWLLERYLATSRRAKFGSGRALFLTCQGKPVPYAVIGHSFQQLRRFAGVGRLNSSYQPRIHDLRHTFAVHSIARWEREGLSTEKMIPLLAAYMGNLNIEGFERYLELSPSSYQAQLNSLKTHPHPSADSQRRPE